MAKTRTYKIKLICDASPALLFMKLFNDALSRIVGPINIGDCPKDVVRLEQYPSPAGTDEVFVSLYPSDAFLRFAATVLAGNFDLSTVDETSHKKSPAKRNSNKC
jgi:hypothetical protein